MYIIEVIQLPSHCHTKLWSDIPYLKIDDMVLFENTATLHRNTEYTLPSGAGLSLGRVTKFLEQSQGEMPYAICKVDLLTYRSSADAHRAAVKKATSAYEADAKKQIEEFDAHRNATMRELRNKYLEDINSK